MYCLGIVRPYTEVCMIQSHLHSIYMVKFLISRPGARSGAWKPPVKYIMGSSKAPLIPCLTSADTGWKVLKSVLPSHPNPKTGAGIH